MVNGMNKHTDSYTAGFMKAAAVLGVSPRRLARRAAIKEASEKRADGEQKGTTFGDGAAYVGSMLAPGLITWPYARAMVTRHLKRGRGWLPTIEIGDMQGAEAAAGSPEHIIETMRVNGGKTVREYLRERGIDLQNSTEFTGAAGPGFFPGRNPAARAALDSLGVSEAASRNGAVLLGFKPGASADAVRGITAHELGHAARSSAGKLRPGLYAGSKNRASLLATIGSLRTARKDSSGGEAAAWTAASTLSSIPMLNEEIQASRLGSKMVGLKGLKRLHAFRGVPTYAALATVPGLVYGGRRLIEKMRGNKK